MIGIFFDDAAQEQPQFSGAGGIIFFKRCLFFQSKAGLEKELTINKFQSSINKFSKLVTLKLTLFLADGKMCKQHPNLCDS